MIKKIYNCMDFGETVRPDDINMGDPVQLIPVFGILEQICLLDNLDIPDLEKREK